MEKFIKSLFCFLIALTGVTVLAFSSAAVAETGTCGKEVTWNFNSKTGELIISGKGDMYDYGWGDSAFYGDTDIKKVTVSKGVTSIGDYAFSYCSGITDVSFAETVENIGYYAFYYCTGLTDVVIPEKASIGNYAFSDCYALANITLPENVTDIGRSVFQNTAYSGNAANWSEGVLYIGQHLIDADSYVLNGSYKIKSGTQTIASFSFYNCTGLTEITLPESLREIGAYGFSKCKSLKQLTIPDNVKKIGDSVFSGCSSLEEIRLSCFTELISVSALSSCESLTSVIIPDGVTSIDNYAFSWCQNLEKIIIPASVTFIDEYAFYGCDRLSDVYYTGSSAEWEKADVKKNNPSLTNAAMHYDYAADCQHKSTKSIFEKDATCTEKGYTAGVYCSDCFTWIEGHATVKAKGHTIVSSGAVSATCTQSGLTAEKKCSDCGVITAAQKVVAAKGHKPKVVPAVEPTCTKTGLTEGKKCYACGKVYTAQKTVKAKGHKIVSLAATEPTCTKTGLTAGKKCSVCGVVTVAQKTVAKNPHKEVAVRAISATCTKTGKTAGKKCSVCGTVTVKQKTVAKKAHTYKDTVTRATFTKNGKITKKCTACGYTATKTTTIYSPKTFKLSTYTYTYAGKVRTPTVTVKDSKGNTLKKDADYTVKYASGRKMPGKYTVTITFKGKYSGKKTLTFKINPAAPKLTKASSAKKGIASLTWSNVSGETGYEVYFSTKKSGGFKKLGTYKVNVTKATKSKLTSGKTYYFKVRAYKSVTGSNLYSSYSEVRAVKIK